MRLVDITPSTENTFFQCLNPKEYEDRRELEIRLQWFEDHKEKGHRARLLVLDDGQTVGLCQTIPTEHSHLIGAGLETILCIWVHGYDRHVGNQQGRGCGRFILNAIEEDARIAGFKGVAAWGLDWPDWMPVSFYEHMGYTPVDRDDKVVVVWKPFCSDAEAPRLMRLPQPARGAAKVNVTVAVNRWCGCYKLICARDAIAGLEHMVDYSEVDTALLHVGKVGGVFLDGVAFGPYQVCTSGVLRAEIIRLYEEKRATAQHLDSS